MTMFPERFNMAEYFLDHNLAAGRGDKVCLRFGDERWTYAEAVMHSNRAGRLLRELGAGVEDRVLIALPDCPQFVACWFGAAKIGSVIAMVNPLLPADDYAYYLDYTRAKVFVVHESLGRKLAAHTGSGKISEERSGRRRRIAWLPALRRPRAANARRA